MYENLGRELRVPVKYTCGGKGAYNFGCSAGLRIAMAYRYEV